MVSQSTFASPLIARRSSFIYLRPILLLACAFVLFLTSTLMPRDYVSSTLHLSLGPQSCKWIEKKFAACLRQGCYEYFLYDCVRICFGEPEMMEFPDFATTIHGYVFGKTSKSSTFTTATQSLLWTETYNQCFVYLKTEENSGDGYSTKLIRC